MIMEKQTQLLDELEKLLNRQTVLAHKGNVAELEALALQADSVVKQISNSKILESSEFQQRRNKLKTLYQACGLALTAEKVEIGRELKKIHKNKKTINVYRNNI
ncbi:MAG: hypothetical protein ACYTBV_10600 [Planctomycetota bacterium]|jgi:protoporphyrinogen oxidase